MKLETLKNLIPSYREIPIRHISTQIWNVPWADGYWLLATDCKAMIFRKILRSEPGLSGKYNSLSGREWEAARPILEHPVCGFEVPLAAVKTWAGGASWLKREPCATCHGTGEDSWVDPDGEFSGVDPCGDCDGGIAVTHFPYRLGRIGEHIFNRTYLACLLETAEDKTVRVDVTDAPQEMVVVNGNGWRVWVMAMVRTVVGDDERKALPDLWDFAKGIKSTG